MRGKAFAMKALLPAVLLVAIPAALWGQYFERNKVQDGPFDSSVLTTDVPGIDDLAIRQGRYFPYRFGDAVWYGIDRQWGKAGMRSFFLDASEKGIPDAVVSAFGTKSLDDRGPDVIDPLLQAG